MLPRSPASVANQTRRRSTYPLRRFPRTSYGTQFLSPPPRFPPPVLLCLAGIKRLQSAQASQDRFRALLSDGEYTNSCMLATQLGELVHSGGLKENSIIVLHDYICNHVQNKKCVCWDLWEAGKHLN